jgi:uncharacterized protein (TIGR03435 family)
MRLATSTVLFLVLLGTHASMQDPASTPAEFEVVSIKRNTGPLGGAGIRTAPDGSFTMTNQPIRSILSAAAPVPIREIEGLPEWTMSERYDIVAKAPAGSTRAQTTAMLRAMLADRLKVTGHVEEREQDVFALVRARSDGRLGPQLRPSTLDCTPGGRGVAPPPTATSGPAALSDYENRCGALMGLSGVASGSMPIGQLVPFLSGLAGAQVLDRTGLEGRYAIKLTFSTRTLSAGTPPSADDPPDIFTALQEQLGLKLQRDKARLPVFVVEHIERPSEN